MREQTDSTCYWSGRSWGLSLGWSPFDELNEVFLEPAVPCEVSLVSRPAVAGTAVLAVGEKVPNVFELLTGRPLIGADDARRGR